MISAAYQEEWQQNLKLLWKKNTFQHECYYIAIKLCKSSVICTQFNILAKKSTSPLLFQFFSLGNATFYYSTVWNFPICFLVYIGFSFSSSVFSFLIWPAPTNWALEKNQEIGHSHMKIWKIFVLDHILLEHNCRCLWKCTGPRAYISELSPYNTDTMLIFRKLFRQMNKV